MELAHWWYGLTTLQMHHQLFAAETSFRTGKTALGKGPEAKKAEKKLFLRFFFEARNCCVCAGGLAACEQIAE